jgi:hypothetical protein
VTAKAKKTAAKRRYPKIKAVPLSAEELLASYKFTPAEERLVDKIFEAMREDRRRARARQRARRAAK